MDKIRRKLASAAGALLVGIALVPRPALAADAAEAQATIDKLVGDAIVAFWGAPQDDALHAQHAVAAVLACRRRVAELNAGWQGSGRPALPTRFGLATGPVVVGMVAGRREGARRAAVHAVADVPAAQPIAVDLDQVVEPGLAQHRGQHHVGRR